MLNTRATCAALALVLALSMGASRASIEKEPVKVTHRNSGPRYDIDEVERTRLNPDANEISSSGSGGGNSPQGPLIPGAQPPRGPQEAPENAAGDSEGQMTPIGHVTVRRIFLVPMMRQESPARDGLWAPRDSAESEQPPHWPPANWPIFARPSPGRHHHLLGQDESSRSPGEFVASSNERPAVGGEREEPMAERPRPPMIDPIQMMIDLMHQALNAGSNSQSGGNFFSDLNKEATGARPTGEAGAESDKKSEESEERPAMPMGATELEKPMKQNNETKEEIVEIDNKKYLRKTIINRHVGPNLIFMTKRLIFIPLNETTGQPEGDSAEVPKSPTTTTTEAPQTSTSGDVTTTGGSTFKVADEPTTTRQPVEDATTTTTAAPTTENVPSSSEPVASTEEVAAASTERPAAVEPTTTTTSSVEETTTPKESLLNKVSDAIDKAAERLVEGAKESLSTTEKSQPAVEFVNQ